MSSSSVAGSSSALSLTQDNHLVRQMAKATIHSNDNTAKVIKLFAEKHVTGEATADGVRYKKTATEEEIIGPSVSYKVERKVTCILL